MYDCLGVMFLIAALFFLIGKRVNFLFHGFDWCIPLGIIERARCGQVPGRDYCTTLPAAYVAIYLLLSRRLKNWSDMHIFKYAVSAAVFLTVYFCLKTEGSSLALMAAFACALAMSGVYQVVWYTELTYLNILAIILVLQVGGDSLLALATVGFLCGVALFQRPNIAWLFLPILAIYLLGTLTLQGITSCAMGAVAAIIGLHLTLPHYTLKTLPRFLKLRSRVSQSWVFMPEMDAYTKLRYLFLYVSLFLLSIFVACVVGRNAAFVVVNGSLISGIALAVAAIGGLKLNKDAKEADCAAIVFGFALISQALPPDIRREAGMNIGLLAAFALVGISSGVSMFRAERIRFQTMAPIERIPADQLTKMERAVMRYAPSLAPESASRQWRDRYASYQEPRAVLHESRLKGLLASARMRSVIDFVQTQIVDAGIKEDCFFGDHLEWLYYAFSIRPSTGLPLLWHNGNLFLDEDVPSFVSDKGLPQNRYFVFTYKNTLRWQEYNYPDAVIDWFKAELVEMTRSEYVILFKKKEAL